MEKRKNLHHNIQAVVMAVLFAAGGGLLWAARRVTGFAEWYSRTIYPVLVETIGRFWGIIPVSVVEIFLYGGVCLLIILLAKYWRTPFRLILHYGTIVAALLFLYAACCGVNYYRVPFSSYYISALVEKRAQAAESQNAAALAETETETDRNVDLKALCAWLTEQVNLAKIDLDQSDGNYENMQAKGVAAMNRLAEQYPALAGFYPQPKPVMVSEILSVQQCSGVYSPFTIEANYNNDMIAYNIPHTICHEMSHLRGFMREDEANFIGYLACLGSEDADYRYSGYLLGWIYAGNALAKVDFEEYVRLHGLLNPDTIAELEANSAFWDRYEGTAAKVQEKVNDTYLKANGQAEGVKTYGRVVDLMLLDFVEKRK